MWCDRFFEVRAGVLWTSYLDHPGISTPESLRGNEAARVRLSRILPSVLPFDALAQTSLGFHRFEPVIGIVSPLPWAMLLTRQGISLCSCKSTTYDRFTSSMLCILLLHVAMPMELYRHRRQP